MKRLLPFVILIISSVCKAQNYNCLQSGVKRYFTNSNGYVRGMRIDSVRTNGTDTIYYPFHTPRGAYQDQTGYPILDSNGGSWLGKKVISHIDGTMIFDDEWGDSVVIKTRAHTGDTWIFYADTSSRYYKATVTSIDTMTVLGTLDSVKNILVNAYTGATIQTSDSINGFRITLTKDHGFARIFDLYTFPYHLPGSLYATKQDYYLDKCTGTLTDFVNYFYLVVADPSPGKRTAIFNLVNNANPTKQQLYDWHPGDVYQYKVCDRSDYTPYSTCDVPNFYCLDTVTSVTTTTSYTQYSSEGLISTKYGPHYSPMTGYYYTTVPSTGVQSCDTTYLAGKWMLEEYGQTKTYYYLPDDTSYATRSALYVSVVNSLHNSIQYQYFFETSAPLHEYKSGIGLTHFYLESEDAGFFVNDTTLIYYSRGSGSAGTYVDQTLLPNRVEEQNIRQAVKVSPNPAYKTLRISATQVITSVVIFDMFGSKVYDHAGDTKNMEIDVADLPVGLYLVKVNGTEVRKFIKQ